jgi:uncharacterized membrane protein HdeD (DUF308 family)
MDLGLIAAGVVFLVLGVLSKTVFTNPSWQALWWFMLILGVISLLWGAIKKTKD